MGRNLLFSSLLLLAACSGGNNEESTVLPDEHVWKSLTETTDRARELEGVLQQGKERQQQQIDEQTR